MTSIDLLHEKAISAAKEFKKSEGRLLEVLCEILEKRIYEKKGYPYLHTYCVEALELTDAQAYTFCGIAKKSLEVPELKEKVTQGAISLSNARRIVPVLKQENKQQWLTKAQDLSQRELERELVTLEPKKITKESIRPVAPSRLEMKLFITPELEGELRRLQDVLGANNLEEVIAFMTKETLAKHDPVEKAKRERQLVARPKSRTRAIPSRIVHQVTRRDLGQCTQVLPNGKRCPARRWTEKHHKIPWSEGGSHDVENLTTLCSAHHRMHHDGFKSLHL